MKSTTMIRLVAVVLCLTLLVLTLMATQQRATGGQRENRNSSIEAVLGPSTSVTAQDEAAKTQQDEEAGIRIFSSPVLEETEAARATLFQGPCNPLTDLNCDPIDRGEKCLSVAARPPIGRQGYSCRFNITDAYGLPAANTPVRIETRWCNKFGSTVRASTSGVTDAQGRGTLRITSPSANVIECALDANELLTFRANRSAVKKSIGTLPTGTEVALTTQVLPRPNATRSVGGIDAGNGRMDLYQSGAYDKVLLIAEQFDQFEHGQANRDRRRFWRQLAPLLTQLFTQGWDVWLVQPHDTGESLHEQSAEFAQAIVVAINAYNQTSQTCLSPTVGVLGFNTGGLVARIATARWEADAAWRTRLGLPAALPVKFIATFDAPNYGMHLNLDMQESMWENKSGFQITTQTNLDSCAASQVLRGRFDPVREQKTNADFLNFFVKGTSVHFFSKLQNTEHTCAAGPAVATLNAARGVPGWPSTPIRIGFAQSNAADRIKCFRPTPNPLVNRNGDGDDLCKHLKELSPDLTFTPSAGQSWMRLAADDPSLPDVFPSEFWDAEDRIEWSDITPGSRSPLFLDGFVTTVTKGPLFIEVFAHQRFPTTLIPFVSAAGTQGPQGSSNYAARPSPFNEMHDSNTSRVADVVDLNEGATMIARLNVFPPGCKPPVVSRK